jgi:hypothetical protein
MFRQSTSRPLCLYVTHHYKQLTETLGIFVCIRIPQQTHQTRDYMKCEEHLLQMWEPNECVCQMYYQHANLLHPKLESKCEKYSI